MEHASTVPVDLDNITFFIKAVAIGAVVEARRLILTGQYFTSFTNSLRR
jgi:hypothetical protein